MFSTGGDSPRAIRLIRCNSGANSQSGGEKKAFRLNAGCRFLLILSKSSYQHPVSILFLLEVIAAGCFLFCSSRATARLGA